MTDDIYEIIPLNYKQRLNKQIPGWGAGDLCETVNKLTEIAIQTI